MSGHEYGGGLARIPDGKLLCNLDRIIYHMHVIVLAGLAARLLSCAIPVPKHGLLI